MKLSELEDAEQIVTKKDLQLLGAELDAKLEKLHRSLLEQIMASERGQRMWIAGLYALVIVSFFIKH